MNTTPLTDIHRLTWTALTAALIAAGACVNLPIGPAPVSMQPLLVALAVIIGRYLIHANLLPARA